MEEMLTIKDIVYKENVLCEHCGHLEPYTAVTRDDNGVCFCMECNDYLVLSDEERKTVEVTETENKIKYFEKRLIDLCNHRKSLEGLIG